MRKIIENLVELPYGLPGTVYRSPMPFSPMFDPNFEVMGRYQSAGVSVVVMLTATEEAREITGLDLRQIYLDAGMRVIHSPVRDFSAPEDGGFNAAIRQTLQAVEAGENIAIHCHAGVGRTGMFAACLAKVVFGMDGAEAVAWVRQFIPRAVENEQQRQFVYAYQPEEG